MVESNLAAKKILRLDERSLAERNQTDADWEPIKEDGSSFSEHELPGVIALSEKRKNSAVMGLKTGSGELRWIVLTGTPVKVEDKPHALMTFQDITERRELETQAKELNYKLKIALKGSRLGVWDWDMQNNSVHFDERYLEMLGYAVDEADMDFLFWEERVHPDDPLKAQAVIQSYLEGKTRTYENLHRLQHKNGSWLYILSQGEFASWDEKGKPTRFVGTYLDVTDLKEAQTKAQLAEKAKTEFLANMSHEIRTPMNGIMGDLDLLKESQLNASQKELTSLMSESSNLLLSIINDVLDLTKIESGKIDL